MQSPMTNYHVTFQMLKIPTHTHIHRHYGHASIHTCILCTYACPCASIHTKIQRKIDRQLDGQIQMRNILSTFPFFCYFLLTTYVIFKQKLIFHFKYWISHMNISTLSYQNQFQLVFGQHILQFEVSVFPLLRLWPCHPFLQFH